MNKSTNDGLVMIEIPCEECINGSVERIGATMPVACLHCDGAGRVELYGDDALDELERREVAAKKSAARAGARAYLAHESFDPPLILRAELQVRWRAGYLEELVYAVDCDPEDAAKELWAIESEAFKAEGAEAHRVAVARHGDAYLNRIECGPYDAASPEGQAWFDGWLAADEPLRQGRMDDFEKRAEQNRRAAERAAPRPPATYPNVRLTPEERREIERRAEVAQLAAEGRSGSLARPAIAALDLDPFAVGVEVSRSSRKARTNAHPGVVAAFAHLAAEPGRARQTSVGGFEAACA